MYAESLREESITVYNSEFMGFVVFVRKFIEIVISVSS